MYNIFIKCVLFILVTPTSLVLLVVLTFLALSKDIFHSCWLERTTVRFSYIITLPVGFIVKQIPYGALFFYLQCILVYPTLE